MRDARRRVRGAALLLLGIGLGLGLAHLGARALADGDPLEEYDFSGDVPLERFVMQDQHRVWQHGLWTVQRHVLLDPFRGSTWSLLGCTFEQINVYYGTRPLWSSVSILQAHVGEDDLGREGVPSWELVADTIDEDHGRRMPLVDRTGGDGITLYLHFWNGGASAGASDELIRLSGNSPATAKVETLWAGDYVTWRDLDGDGLPELVDSDNAHWYASYLPWKGFQGRVYRTYDRKAGRYVLAPESMILAAQQPEAGARYADLDAYVEARCGAVRTAMRASQGSGDDAGHLHLVAVLTLAETLWDLLVFGRIDAAVALFREVVPAEADLAGPPNKERLSREAWWQAFAKACRASDAWKELVARYPQLARL